MSYKKYIAGQFKKIASVTDAERVRLRELLQPEYEFIENIKCKMMNR